MSEVKTKDNIEWIFACVALDKLKPILGEHDAKSALLKRVNAGLIRTKAKILTRREGSLENSVYDAEIPPEYFWAGMGAALSAQWSTGDFSSSTNSMRAWLRWDALGLQFNRAGVDELVAESAPLVAASLENVGSPKSLKSEEAPARKPGRPSKSHFEAVAWVSVQVADLSAAEFERETFETITERLSAAYKGMKETPSVEKSHAMAVLRGIRRARAA